MLLCCLTVRQRPSPRDFLEETSLHPVISGKSIINHQNDRLGHGASQNWWKQTLFYLTLYDSQAGCSVSDMVSNIDFLLFISEGIGSTENDTPTAGRTGRCNRGHCSAKQLCPELHTGVLLLWLYAMFMYSFSLLYHFVVNHCAGSGWDEVFFTTTCTVLCFWLVTKAVLITFQWFSCCWPVLAQPQRLLPIPLSASLLREGKRLGGDRAGIADPTDQKDIPYPVTSCSATKLGRGSKIFRSSHCTETSWTSVCWWEEVNDCLCITWGWVFFFFFWSWGGGFFFFVFGRFFPYFLSCTHWSVPITVHELLPLWFSPPSHRGK